MLLQPNLTHKDLEMRALFNQRDFRIALSLGMNRKELIDIALLGEGEPWQLGAYEGDPRYDERLGRQFTEYDPARANQLLDGLGFTSAMPKAFACCRAASGCAFRSTWCRRSCRNRSICWS